MFSVETVSPKETPTIKSCGECGKLSSSDEKLLRCSRCKNMWYCDRTCQKNDWSKHKSLCVKPPTEEKSVVVIKGVPSLNPSFLDKAKETYFISSAPSSSPSLTPEQMEDAQKLIDIKPLDSILDRGPTEKRCKELGQEFFDKYKKAAGGDSMAGKEAVQAICNWIRFNCEDGKLRKQYIEYAWHGIGDDAWDWRR